MCDWAGPLTVNDVLELLLAVKHAAATARRPVILVLNVNAPLRSLSDLLSNCFKSTLPALLDSCEALALVLERPSPGGNALCSALRGTRQSGMRTQVFDSLSAAFLQYQRLAPYDVLELQRHVLRRSAPPTG